MESSCWALKKNGQFSISGLTDTDKVLKEIATGANNPSVVSANLLNDQLIEVIELLGGSIIKVTIPEAPRKQRPIYLKNTPFNHSYRRFNDSDQLMSDEDVKRALAEQVNETRDNEILVGYGIDDLNLDSLKRYRQLIAVRTPQHPFNEVDDLSFLERIGAWRKDRETGQQGLTLAGLLMFGQDYLIREKLPNYQLDYRDGFDPKYDSETRWIDRVTLDGTWSGNLFDFYQIIYRKLTTDLKVPFELEKGVRKDSTPLHDAIRESLCNVLVHADYSGRTSVLIEKKPDMILFRNPGLMRIPVETAIRGGEPDCRNRILHQMFFYIGAGERSGTGIPTVFKSVKHYHWKAPSIEEYFDPSERTELKLWMTDLLPKGTMELLARHLGKDFASLGYLGQIALGIALSEKTVSHDRLTALCTEHASDISKTLNKLVDQGYLIRTGQSRGASYHLTMLDDFLPKPDEFFGSNTRSSSSNTLSSDPNTRSSSSNTLSSDPNTRSSDIQRDHLGRRISDYTMHRCPIIDNLSEVDKSLLERLKTSAKQAIEKAKLPCAELEKIIFEICQEHYVPLSVLAELLNRNPDSLRKQYLTRLVKSGQLELAFPTERNSPNQAYLTSNQKITTND
ncbi:MAG: AAA family ATPase [Thiomicrospira sp.]|uniref:ATP-binding protein n=1 Tax=Thiomicrospira sp. TaxID=935 RepID=UPI0019F6C5F8|nr:ATP-binding protein [Thiomicrospira sp.]MBE0494721.1 AAA family ATPase [Thiomicrospira sp.]